MSDIARFPLYDLHSHTRASDGLLTPEALAQRAVSMRIGVLAITDHDSVAGVEPAQRAVAEQGLPLKMLAGVEASTLWENHEIHIVGLNLDIHHAALTAFLAQQHQSRQARAEQIAERLEKARIPGTLAGATRLADGGVITRGHFARFLMEQGKANTVAQVFKNYLARGKTGYVPPKWCTIKQAIDAIHHSGGCAVLAHPGRYGLSSKWLKRLIAHFREAGGDAIEVAQCQQAPNERTQLAQYARDDDLAASQGSDFHQPCPWIELGRKLWLPAGVEPVWKRFPTLAPACSEAER
ncbi:RNase RNM [Candidatus Pantoea persica]|uniref:RNase RNM n=1 Tax=Candidatus Pantoea persica TaxID=2518128 RepID=UPI00215D681C|nr:PHP domain-containing protein [Candidatus Pantoea persica]MBA2814449.1 Histidinol phosphatase of the PHP family protein [Candidatus Pantoea persica]